MTKCRNRSWARRPVVVSPEAVIMNPENADLVYDPEYVQIRAFDYGYPLRYTLQAPRIRRIRPIHGTRSVGYGIDINAYNEILPLTTRTTRLRSEEQIVSEEYGTSPYLARGDGIMFHLPVDTQLRYGQISSSVLGGRSRHVHTEAQQRIPDYNFKELVAPQFNLAGVSARSDPVYCGNSKDNVCAR